MKQRKTGVGELSSKLLTILSFVVLSFGAFGQNSSGGNSVYIDQVNADASTVTITQTGSNNTIGDPNSLTTPAFVFDGNGITATITQDGMNNSITGGIIGGGTTALINQTGNNNSTNLNMGNMGTDNGNLNIGITGNNNTTGLNIGTLRDSSNYNYSLSITGNSNSVTSTINSKNTNNNIQIAGDSNTITTTQSGSNGSSTTGGHAISINNIGSNNTIGVLQNGTTNPNSAIVNVTGSGASVSVTQH
jgi:hypothetical protein